jgi:predicted Zn-dependent protease
MGGQLMSLKFSRDDETEADTVVMPLYERARTAQR